LSIFTILLRVTVLDSSFIISIGVANIIGLFSSKDNIEGDNGYIDWYFLCPVVPNIAGKILKLRNAYR